MSDGEDLARLHHSPWSFEVSAALGMLIAVTLWWIYYARVSQRMRIAEQTKNVWPEDNFDAR